MATNGCMGSVSTSQSRNLSTSTVIKPKTKDFKFKNLTIWNYDSNYVDVFKMELGEFKILQK